jgi:hypothetical protein
MDWGSVSCATISLCVVVDRWTENRYFVSSRLFCPAPRAARDNLDAALRYGISSPNVSNLSMCLSVSQCWSARNSSGECMGIFLFRYPLLLREIRQTAGD